MDRGEWTVPNMYTAKQISDLEKKNRELARLLKQQRKQNQELEDTVFYLTEQIIALQE